MRKVQITDEAHMKILEKQILECEEMLAREYAEAVIGEPHFRRGYYQGYHEALRNLKLPKTHKLWKFCFEKLYPWRVSEPKYDKKLPPLIDCHWD